MADKICTCVNRELAYKYYNDPYNYSRRYFKSPREYAYTLRFPGGVTLILGAAFLKNEIANGNVYVANLKLTSDYKLIMSKPANAENNTKEDNVVTKLHTRAGVTLSKKLIKNIDSSKALKFSHRDTRQLAAKAAMLGDKSILRKVYGVTVVETFDSIIICSLGNIRLPEDCREMFYVSSFKSIDFTNVDWSNVKHIDGMFGGSAAKSIVFGDVHKANIWSMKAAFEGARVKSLDLTKFNTSRVKDMSRLFCNCKARKIVMDGIDTSNVETMYCMFCSCNAEVSIKGINTSNVKDMELMFSHCMEIRIDYTQINTSSVENMKCMFRGYRCSGSLDISSFNTSKVEVMEGLFLEARIKYIVLGKIDTKNVKNMAFMFAGLETGIIDLSGINTRSVNDIEGMFRGLTAYSVILGRYFNTSNVESFINVFRDCQVKYISMRSIDTSKGKTFLGMFRDSQFEELDLSNFRTENAEDFNCMFKGCAAKVINLSSFRTPALKSMSNMFEGCKCEVIDLSTFSADSLENISYAFDSSKAVKIIFGKQFITRKLQYAIDCFRASKAVALDLRTFDASSLAFATGMCRDCNAKVIDFGNFNPPDYSMCYYMFGSEFEGKIKTTSENILKSYENRKIGYPTL